MFGLLVFILGCSCDEQAFVQNVSLLAPFVDNSGVSLAWEMHGKYLIKVNGNEPFIQLGHLVPGTSGGIMTTHPIGSEKFSIDVNVEIDEGDAGREDSDGMAIWLANEDKFARGACFGRSCDFKGLIVIIKPSGDSYIGVKAGDVSIDPHDASAGLDRVMHGDFSFNTPFIIRIVQSNYELSVYIGKSHDDLSLIHSYRSNIVGTDYRLGISASTGRSSNVFRILGVESYHLKGIKGRYVKEESQHGGRLIWLLFFVVVGITGYYLYSIQIKKKD